MAAKFEWALSKDRRSATAHIRGRTMPLPRGMVRLKFRLAERGGCTVKPGWSPRKGRRFEFLPRRKPCRNTADQAFLPSINLNSAVSCLAGTSSVCSSEPRRKLYGPQSRTDHRTGRPQMAHPGLNDSGFSASFDRRNAESSGLRRLAVPCATK